MRLKKEYLILAAVIIALTLYLVLRKSDRTHYRLPELPRLAQTDISKIDIATSGTTIVLNRKDQAWHIGPREYPADTDKVSTILGIIEKLALTALVSESENYDRYDLNDDKKITVRAWTGDKVAREFDVGKVAPSYRHTFVKIAGDKRVFHARENFRDKFDQTVDDLRDKTVLAFDTNEIQEIQLTKGEQSMVFSRKQIPVEGSSAPESDAKSPPSQKTSTFWQSRGGQEGDEAKLSRLVATLSKLRCEKYVKDRKKEEFNDPIYAVHLKGVQDYSLSVFAKKEEGDKSYPAISSENHYPFLLSDSQAERIMPNPEDLLKKKEKS